MKTNTITNTIQQLSAKLNFMPQFGDLVRLARLDKNLSQRQLAQRVGKSPTYISYVESGVNPSSRSGVFQPGADAVKLIAGVLGIPIDDALLAAGYAPTQPVGLPQNRRELLDALERIGVAHIEFHEEIDGATPEELQEVFDAVRIAVEITITRQGKK